MSTAVTLPSVCPLDCPDTCSLSVDVVDGVVTKVRGSTANPFTAGKICNKVARGLPGLVHGETRLAQPLARRGEKGEGVFEPVSWEEAIDTIHARYTQIIERHGPQSIVPFNYSGPGGILGGGALALRFFHRLGASLVSRAPLCAGAFSEAYESVFGEVAGIPPEEIVDSKLIVIWGNNITVSSLHLTSLIRRARANGAKLVVIDPKRIKIAEEADLYLGLVPGSDVVLGYAIAAELERLGALDREFIANHVKGVEEYLARAREFSLERAAEICGLREDDLRTFAQLWRDSRPAFTSVGIGPERNRNGGGGIRTAFALPVLTGNFGVRGAGVLGATWAFFPTRDDAITRPDLVPVGTRELNILDIPGHILDSDCDPPIESVFIFNHNPVAVHPRQKVMQRALARDDLFTVGCDIAMTDSMAYADVVLPAATHLEYADLYPAYGHQYLQRAEPVIEPVGGSLCRTVRSFGDSRGASVSTTRSSGRATRSSASRPSTGATRAWGSGPRSSSEPTMRSIWRRRGLRPFCGDSRPALRVARQSSTRSRSRSRAAKVFRHTGRSSGLTSSYWSARAPTVAPTRRSAVSRRSRKRHPSR